MDGKNGLSANVQKQTSYTVLNAHYSSNEIFCNLTENHEKDMVEILIGLARKNIWLLYQK